MEPSASTPTANDSAWDREKASIVRNEIKPANTAHPHFSPSLSMARDL